MFPDEPDRPTLSHSTDHVARGLARLTDRWQRPAIRAVLASHLAEVQEVEDALWEVLLLDLDTATGDGLSQIAGLVGEPRQDLDDDTLRTVVRARLLANRARGDVDTLHAIALCFVEDGFTVDEYFPAGMVARFEATTGINPRVAGLLRRGKSGGVGLHVVMPTEGGGAFRLSSELAAVELTFTGLGPLDPSDPLDELDGGKLAEVYA